MKVTSFQLIAGVRLFLSAGIKLIVSWLRWKVNSLKGPFHENHSNYQTWKTTLFKIEVSKLKEVKWNQQLVRLCEAIHSLAFNKSLSTWRQLAVVNVSLNFHSCHDGDSITIPCPVPLSMFFEASEFDVTGILLYSLIKQLVRRFCFHRGFFQGLLGLRFQNTNCHQPTITEIPSNNPIQFTGMI